MVKLKVIIYFRSGLEIMKTSVRIRSAGLFSTYMLDNQLCSNALKLWRGGQYCCWENVFYDYLSPIGM